MVNRLIPPEGDFISRQTSSRHSVCFPPCFDRQAAFPRTTTSVPCQRTKTRTVTDGVAGFQARSNLDTTPSRCFCSLICSAAASSCHSRSSLPVALAPPPARLSSGSSCFRPEALLRTLQQREEGAHDTHTRKFVWDFVPLVFQAARRHTEQRTGRGQDLGQNMQLETCLSRRGSCVVKVYFYILGTGDTAHFADGNTQQKARLEGGGGRCWALENRALFLLDEEKAPPGAHASRLQARAF